jgi:hypothetical protein
MLDIQTNIHAKDGEVTIERVQDCTAIADFARAKHNEGHHGSSDMKHAASIPFVMIEKYLNDNNITFHEFSSNNEHIRRVLNDPAMKHFRIWPGKV